MTTRWRQSDSYAGFARCGTIRVVALLAVAATVATARWTDGDPPGHAATTSAPASGPAGAVVDADGLKRVVASYRGKVVLLDFWATWCKPCVEGLPHLKELQKRFGERGFQIIAVSFDEPRDWTRRAQPVLRRAGWAGPAVVAKDRETQNAIVDWLGKEWRSELPARYVINRKGEVVYEVLEVNADRLPPLDTLIEEQMKRR